MISYHTLRLSVTERCNFNCLYCRPQGEIGRSPDKLVPTLSELGDAVEWLIPKFGINRIKLTGGEPLMRSGLPDLIAKLIRFDGIDEISLTTNGSKLSEQAIGLAHSGLKRVNVSLDSLNPARFREICGVDLKKTVEGIKAAIEAGLTPVKINAVLHRSYWKEDVPALLQFAGDHNLEIRFIELMPVGTGNSWALREFVPAYEVRKWLANKAGIEYLIHSPGNPSRPSIVNWGNTKVSVGWITPETETFCKDCDRLRLDCKGRLRRCLMDENYFHLLDHLKSGQMFEAELEEYLQAKHPPINMRSDHSMVSVGG